MSDLNPPKISIDNYHQLIEDSLEHTKVISDGKVSDTSPAGFMRPFAGTLAFVASETLYLANLSAEAAAKSFLSEVVGIPSDDGVKASVEIQFMLNSQLTLPFTIPANFLVSDSSGTIRFYTDVNLIIPAGAIAGNVSATAESIGTKYNLSAGLINRFSTPLTYLSSCINTSNATGGREPETPTDLIERASTAIRLRNPVSAFDFENLAQLILGDGSRAKAIGLLAADKSSKELGVVHIFVLNADGSTPNQSQMSTLGSTIATRLMLGTKLLISEIDLDEIYIDCIVDSTDGIASETIANNCFESLKSYFDYRTFSIGSSILLEELKYIIRDTGGVTIQYLEINGNPLNVELSNQWTLPRFTGLNITIIDGKSSQTFSLFIPTADE